MSHPAPTAVESPRTPSPARVGASRPAKKVRELEATVGHVIRETRDTVTLVLNLRERAEYAAGQFLTIDPHQFDGLADLIAYFEDVKGKREPARAYSLCSTPLEAHVAVTVKEERYVRGSTIYPALLSPYIVRGLQPGQEIRIVGFTGAYVLPADVESRTDHLVHVVAGSGSVPSYAIVKYALDVYPRIRHTFVYSNKFWDEVIFREELDALQVRHPDRFRVLHTLTREEEPERHGEDVRRGRVSAELLRELIPDPRACLVYACGPAVGAVERAAAKARGEVPHPRFLESVQAALAELGVPREHLKTEAYG